jgi:hypothetical protein
MFDFFFFFFEIRSCYVAQAFLKLTILLLLPPKCWDYRCVLQCPAIVTSDCKSKACLLSR